MTDGFIAPKKALLDRKSGDTEGAITVAFDELFLLAKISPKTFVAENVANAVHALLREFIFHNDHRIV